MKVRAVGDKIIVKQQEVKQVSDAGILLMGAAEAPLQGVVVAVGKGKYDEKGVLHPLEVEVGDVVAFQAHAQKQEITVDGERFIVMFEQEILAILDNAD